MESSHEYRQDLVLGICFSITFICGASRTRLYFDPTGNGRIITIFYLLISLTSLLRAVWFFIPSQFLEGSYTPQPVMAFEFPQWTGYLVSEVLLVAGSIGIYSIFILVLCYWAHMLRKVEAVPIEPSSRNSHTQQLTSSYCLSIISFCPVSPVGHFLVIIGFILLFELVNIMLFSLRFYNGEVMIVFDSALLSVVSLATLFAMTYYSHRIRSALRTFGIINSSITKPQINRIVAITLLANLFFVCRVAIELGLCITVITLMKEQKSFSILFSQKYWDIYIATKHFSEAIVLVLQLIISTAIKAYDQNANPRSKQSKAFKRSQHQPQSAAKATEFTPLISRLPGTPANSSKPTGESEDSTLQSPKYIIEM